MLPVRTLRELADALLEIRWCERTDLFDWFVALDPNNINTAKRARAFPSVG